MPLRTAGRWCKLESDSPDGLLGRSVNPFGRSEGEQPGPCAPAGAAALGFVQPQTSWEQDQTPPAPIASGQNPAGLILGSSEEAQCSWG